MLLESFALIFLLYLFTVLYSRWKLYKLLLGSFPSPPRRPFIGTLYLFPLSDPPGIFRVQLELLKKYGNNILLTKPIWDPLLLISDRRDIERILADPNTKMAKKSVFYEQIEDWLGNGILTGYGEKWFKHRRTLTPSFHFSILDGFVEVMSQQADILVQNLGKLVGKGSVDIHPEISAFALDVICETSMGVTVNAQSDPDSKYVTSVQKATVGMQKKFLSPLSRYDLLYGLTKNSRYLKSLIKVLHDFSTSVIVKRREQILSSEPDGKSTRMNFLDILLRATVDGRPLTNGEIRDEVDTFMFAGHDTTASGIAFTMYLLAKHPDIQEKVYKELISVFGSKEQMAATRQTLSELKYLEKVVKESLRILPPVPNIGRQLLEDTLIGDVMVPRGVNLSLSIFRLHHNPEYFPDPERFDPERFSPERIEDIPQFAYVPFSAGGRNCIGQKFAMMDLKLSVAKTIMNYRLSTEHDIVLQNDIVTRPSNGIYVTVEKR